MFEIIHLLSLVNILSLNLSEWKSNTVKMIWKKKELKEERERDFLHDLIENTIRSLTSFGISNSIIFLYLVVFILVKHCISRENCRG